MTVDEKELDRIKVQGQVQALSGVLDSKLFKLKNLEEGIKRDGYYFGLEVKLKMAAQLIEEAGQLLTEIKIIQPRKHD